MQKIQPFLWFDGDAEEAARFYVSVFGDDSRLGAITHYGEGAPLPAGTVLTVTFTLRGQQFVALNGAPDFPFTQAVSFAISCDTQEEIDRFWARLTEGGQEVQCGWLEDRYGLSWQVVPSELPRLIGDPDPARRDRVMQALMRMVKLDIAALRRAHAG